MKLAILSDVHLGDARCGVVTNDADGSPRLGERYGALLDAVGTDNDYLVLLGDIFDFSVAGYGDVFAAARVFLDALHRDRVAREVIYLPGNHDFAMWHLIEYEVNVTRRVHLGKTPRNLRGAVPAVIDARSSHAGPTFELPDVTPRPAESSSRYGGLFLDDLTTPAWVFNVAYPNLYLVTDDDAVLVTHGHYLEPFWAMLSEWAPQIAGPDLEVGSAMTLGDMVKINFPLNQLASSGLGQAGPLTAFVRRVQHGVESGQLEEVERWFGNLDDAVDRMTDYGWYDPREWMTDLLSAAGRNAALDALRGYEGTRYDEELLTKPAVQARFARFLAASLLELDRLNSGRAASGSPPLPLPTEVIFGHTHQPIAWADDRLRLTGPDTMLGLHNCGGWLYREDGSWPGAEVFRLRDGRIDSIRI